MKKTIAILLCLAVLLAMAACSNAPNENGNDASNKPSEETTPQHNSTENMLTVPTEEELAQIEKYKVAVVALDRYVKDGTIPSYKDGEEYLDKTESLARYYNDILAAECVEKWIGTQYTSDNEVNWNRQEILDNFVVVENVLLQIKSYYEDHLGNRDPYEAQYTYGANGNLVEIAMTSTAVFPWGYGWSIETYEALGRQISYIYEENKLIKIQCFKNGSIVCTMTPSYNENGLKIKDLFATINEQFEYTYTYDSNDRLTTVSSPYGTKTLSYDDKGNLTEFIESDRHRSTQYTYNDDYSVCTAKIYEGSELIYTCTYSFDEAGRLLTQEFDCYNSQTVKGHYELIYGNYYIYKPAVQN